jgi:hypothetical protein
MLLMHALPASFAVTLLLLLLPLGAGVLTRWRFFSAE